MPLAPRLNRSLIRFIETQPLFFVATAAPEGRVNLSPKGADTLRILSEDRILWLNLTGSGNETAGHLRQSNRITMMFCAFEGNALILRVYGRAETLHPRDRGWREAAERFDEFPGRRQIFDVTVEGVQTSCGTGVPIMRHEGGRAEAELLPFYDEMGPEGVADYWRRKNLTTIDGAPTGLDE